MHSWIWMKCCASTDVGTWTNWLTFEPDPDYSLDAGNGLLSAILYSAGMWNFASGKSHVYVLARPTAAAMRSFKIFSFTQPSKHFCRRYMHSTECPSNLEWFNRLIVLVLLVNSFHTWRVYMSSAESPCRVLLCWTHRQLSRRWRRGRCSRKLPTNVDLHLSSHFRESLWLHKISVIIELLFI